MFKLKFLLSLVTLFLTVLNVQPLPQSDADLVLRLSKDNGFSSGNQIRGAFTLTAQGPADLASVTFYMDDTVMGTVSQAPFTMRFRTGDYPYGRHTMRAEGQTSSGQVLQSNVREMEFVSSEQAQSATQEIVLPLFGVIALVLLLTFGGQFLVFRGKSHLDVPLGAQRNYGVTGGSICPKCGRPTPVHIWGFNIMVGKFDRCENCGKWSVMTRYPIDALRAAEAAELEREQSPAVLPDKPEERLRSQIEDSRYTDR